MTSMNVRLRRRNPMISVPRVSAFTLFEMLVTISVFATVAILAYPSFEDTGRLRLGSASSVLTSDIELAQVMTISHPNEPIVVRFDPLNSTYWLARAATPDTPIVLTPGAAPYQISFGRGRAADATGVTFELVDIADDTLAFNAQGGLTDFTLSPEIRLAIDDHQVRLAIAATTGTVSESAP